MSNISEKQYAQALYLAFTETNADAQDAIISNLESTLRNNGDWVKYAKVIEEFEKIANEAPKQEVKIMETHEVVTDAQVMDMMNMRAKETIITKEMDDDLVGGVIIRTESEQIDLSVRNKLETLRNNLVS